MEELTARANVFVFRLRRGQRTMVFGRLEQREAIALIQKVGVTEPDHGKSISFTSTAGGFHLAAYVETATGFDHSVDSNRSMAARHYVVFDAGPGAEAAAEEALGQLRERYGGDHGASMADLIAQLSVMEDVDEARAQLDDRAVTIVEVDPERMVVAPEEPEPPPVASPEPPPRPPEATLPDVGLRPAPTPRPPAPSPPPPRPIVRPPPRPPKAPSWRDIDGGEIPNFSTWFGLAALGAFTFIVMGIALLVSLVKREPSRSAEEVVAETNEEVVAPMEPAELPPEDERPVRRRANPSPKPNTDASKSRAVVAKPVVGPATEESPTTQGPAAEEADEANGEEPTATPVTPSERAVPEQARVVPVNDKPQVRVRLRDIKPTIGADGIWTLAVVAQNCKEVDVVLDSEKLPVSKLRQPMGERTLFLWERNDPPGAYAVQIQCSDPPTPNGEPLTVNPVLE